MGFYNLMNYSVLSSAPMPRQECTLRILCIICGLDMITMGVLLFVLYDVSSILDGLLQTYYVYGLCRFFGMLMIIIEFDFRFIKKYWRFLVESFGKGLFYIL